MTAWTIAVIRTGGKQYVVQPGDILRIEKIPGSAAAQMIFEEVLFISDKNGQAKVGQPLVKGAHVVAAVTAQRRHRRVKPFRKSKEGWARTRGHRQPYTEVRIISILFLKPD
jgi:large subunit ribosomal protein L21